MMIKPGGGGGGGGAGGGPSPKSLKSAIPPKSASPKSSSSPAAATNTTTTTATVTTLVSMPGELHLSALTFLRASDLSALQRTCRRFNDRPMIAEIVEHFAAIVYPPELTDGFDTPIVSGEVESVAVASKRDHRRRDRGRSEGGNADAADDTATSSGASAPPPPAIAARLYTYEMLRNMEMLVVARVLSRPEPSPRERESCFYVSKSWCRAALRWLEVQREEQKERAKIEEEILTEARRQRQQASAANEAAASSTRSPSHHKGAGKNRGGNNHRPPHEQPQSSGKKQKKKKPSRKELKEQRLRERRVSDAMPPWPNVNVDIACEHGDLKRCSSKSARARRRIMDRQAWKVLKRLYPDSAELEARMGGSGGGGGGDNSVIGTGVGYGSSIAATADGCLLCAAEAETARKAEADERERANTERRRPLSCPLVRGFYTRGGKGYPAHALAPPPSLPLPLSFHSEGVEDRATENADAAGDGTPSPSTAKGPTETELWRPLPPEPDMQRCPLLPGVYCALPRSWCHRWRKHMKSGGGDGAAGNGPLLPPAPAAGEVTCEAHDLPLVPPHLEAFLRGDTPALFDCAPIVTAVASFSEAPPGAAAATTTLPPSDDGETCRALRAAGMSGAEVRAQRAAMAGLEEEEEERRRRGSREGEPGGGAVNPPAALPPSPQQRQQRDRAMTNEQLDRENRVVVEILTDEEMTALDKWCPRMYVGRHAMRFAVVDSNRGGGEGDGRADVLWSMPPCRECDPSGRGSTTKIVVRNRFQKRGYC